MMENRKRPMSSHVGLNKILKVSQHARNARLMRNESSEEVMRATYSNSKTLGLPESLKR
jgi:hypothetical protein